MIGSVVMTLPGTDQLSLLSRELAAHLGSSPGPAARRAAVAVAELAVRRTGLQAPAIVAALDALVSGRGVTGNVRALARAALARLDDAYFASRDRGDPDPEWQQRFARARAANAVVDALHAWTWRRWIPGWSRFAALDAACNAAYEACAAIDDLAPVAAAVSRVLSD
jgi:hypothetical protein